MLDGRLTAANPQLARDLAQATKAASAGLGGQTLASPDGAFRVAVDPLEGSISGPGAGGATPMALVRLRDETARRGAALARAAARLALTPAERALAAAVMQGLAPAEHARARGVSIDTVRTQMRALYGKAGVSTRAELMVALRS